LVGSVSTVVKVRFPQEHQEAILLKSLITTLKGAACYSSRAFRPFGHFMW
jgi:hypothetical protein